VIVVAGGQEIVHLLASGALDVLVSSARALGPIAIDSGYVYFSVATATGVEIRRVLR
jgi:hypothetical protein